jgi:citrate lyase subunit beta/citryl-CoA lyase
VLFTARIRATLDFTSTYFVAGFFMTLRPRRSVLYMPGSNPRALEKAKALDADVLILDLEDAVAPEKKLEARELVIAAVKGGGYGRRELVVRVNGLDTPWGADDIRAVANIGADAICLPKVETAQAVQQAARLLESEKAPENLKIWIMAETPAGVLNIQSSAAAHERLTAIMMGTSDLAKDLRVPHSPGRAGFLTSLGLCVLAARANNLDIIDGVHIDLEDDEGLLAVCKQGRELGFDGKSLIHPKQLAVSNEIFAPSAAEIERAKKIINAWKEAEARQLGVVLVDGKLVEALHVEEAKRVLAIVEAITR